jgi:dipeptidyl aminopeptidase/acylaminoacyl peptidase
VIPPHPLKSEGRGEFTLRSFFTFVLVCLVACNASAQDDLPAYGQAELEDFLDIPEVTRPVLSPNGRYLAFMVHTDHAENGDVLVIRDLDDPDDASVSQTGFGHFPIINIAWASNERVLITLLRNAEIQFRGFSLTTPVTRTVSYDRRDMSQPTILFEGEGRRVFGNLYNAFGNDLVDTLAEDPQHVLMAAYRGEALHLWRVNIFTGEADVEERGNSRTTHWHTNAGGFAVMRVDVNQRGGRVEVMTRQPGERRWRRTARFRTNELSDRAAEFEWAGISDEPGQIYVFSRREGSDRRGVYLYDLNTETYIETMAEHDRVDISHVMISQTGGVFLGYAFSDDRLEVDMRDPELRRHYSGLVSFFGDEVTVLPSGFAGDRMVLFVTGPREPGSYYLYDRATRSVDPVMTLRPRLPPDVLHSVETLRYRTSDGLELTAYLTRPRAGMGPDTPLVLMPHGGPEQRDTYGFDLFAQYYASRGYAVLQPNFRGSSGYGRTFAESGYRRWGARMQLDLDEAVQSLINQRRVAPDRVCIAGFSYGGYAALMGGATRPDLYQCVFAGAAVTDLIEFVDGWQNRNEDAHEYWTMAIGDTRSERDRLYAVSPVHLAERMTMPVLLAHSQDDPVVPYSQTVWMAEALEAAGGDFHFESFNGAGHSFGNDNFLRSLLTQTTQMFDRTIGPERGQHEDIFPDTWLNTKPEGIKDETAIAE